MRASRHVLAAIVLTVLWPTAGTGQNVKPIPPKPPAVDTFGDPLPEGALARLGTLRFRTPGLISAAALSPDGKVIAAANEQRIYLLDAGSGWKARRLLSTTKVFYTLLFSPNGSIIAGISRDPQIQLWDVATGQILPAIVLHKEAERGRVVNVTLSGDGAILAVGREYLRREARSFVQIYSAYGKELREIEVLHNYRAQVALAADGKRLLTWGYAHQLKPGNLENQFLLRTIQLWDVATGKELRRFTIDQNQVVSAALSPDGNRIAAVGTGSTVYLFDADSDKEPLRLVGLRSAVVRSLLFSPDGKHLASFCSPEGVAQIWDLASGRHLGVHEGSAARQNGFTFTADGNAIAWKVQGESLVLWDVLAGKPLSPTATHRCALTSLVFASNGRELHSASVDGHILVWDVAEAKMLSAAHLPDDARNGHHIGEIHDYGMWLFPDGRHVLGGNPNGSVRLWDRVARKALYDFDGSNSGLRDGESRPSASHGLGVPASADGRWLALTEAGRTIRLWDTRDGRLLRQFKPSDEKQTSA